MYSRSNVFGQLLNFADEATCCVYGDTGTRKFIKDKQKLKLFRIVYIASSCVL